MKINDSDRSDRNRRAIAGLRKHSVSLPAIVLSGVPRTPDDVAQVLQTSIDANDAADAAAAVFHKAVLAKQAANVTSDATFRDLKALVSNQFKTAPDTLADFGITLPSRQVPTADTVADAVDKRNATRAARHTMGKRQKANVKGTVTTAPATPPVATKPVS
jgi:hypothetical protein